MGGGGVASGPRVFSSGDRQCAPYSAELIEKLAVSRYATY